ncbi:MAG: alpha-amylase family glycosyl hydrolase [Candidatus Neomarinimicrobiota bacterium]|jgi:pullulanase/glycogen debranching enzyme|nr:alpha-amylase family glycosyl hydrolase [Candidatus Neomarinimicrobiota bacterium]MDD3966090.1 alpha-amylase family glycosyl hydrolase [Candidatus Neomarinimicrobiota bacterium]MDX9780575.1 alpha-amylase family glycosyl hydrolase [bacterium]
MKHPPGCQRIGSRTYFTLYAPYAKVLRLAIFSSCQDEKPLQLFPMRMIGGGWWEYSDIADLQGLYYAYLIDGNKHYTADPYARALATRNDYRQDARGRIDFVPYEWENDDFIPVRDPRDLLIYECHLRDLTAHPASKTPQGGSYEAAHSRIAYFRELGINAVEFQPLMLFANHEPPYKTETEKVFNDWNPYAYNHWGYMTSFFFAPANIYAADASRDKGVWCDPQGKDVKALKDLIKALHKAGIAVIMDVVYNHISQYNHNPLRDLAADHYLHFSENFSGCGNDVNSESPVMRQLILDSVEYWMREYHIDGFRFDLAGILEDETLMQVRERARFVNPHAILIGEPWGKRYFPQQLSGLGYAVWNDHFRNGIKGENPEKRPGFLFAAADVTAKSVFRFLSGSLQEDGGIVADSRYSLNYLESHDGFTLGDFIRICLRDEGKRVLKDHDKHVRLSQTESRLHRMAAFVLAFSQGIPMIHAGQEFARSKVIAEVPDVNDPHAGELDDDSYSKDNETNYLNDADMRINAELLEYYRALFALRRQFPELRKAARESIRALYDKENPFAVGYRIDAPDRSLAVLLNCSPDKNAHFDLGGSLWQVLADSDKAGTQAFGQFDQTLIKLGKRSALLLLKSELA